MLTVYSKPNCPHCEQAKSWLDSNKIEYEVVDVSVKSEALEMLKEHGHKSVPQLYLNGETFVLGGWEGLKTQDPDVLKEQIELSDLRGFA
jgi:glutaredoxin-like protein NrdH